MNKRGVGISFETVVVAVLVLVVLGVVIAIFVTQSNKYAREYESVSDTATSQAKGCSLFFGRYCEAKCESGDKLIGKSDKCAPDQVCCEKKSSENE